MVYIGIDQVVVGPRARPLNLEKVENLCGSIERIGLLQSIVVTEQFGLVAGRHRLEACRRLGWETIAAEVLNGDELLAALAEIDENLIRNELTALEEAEHLLKRSEILEALGMRAQVGRNQYGSKLVTTADIASDVGISKSTANQRMQTARNLIEEAKELIRHTEFADRKTDLLYLSRLGDKEQVEIAQVIAKGIAENLDGAKELLARKLVHVSRNSGEMEWYTPPEYIDAARKVMGGIDLDPASNALANQTVRAITYYTVEDNGLSKEWHGRVWLSPPYSQPLITQFCKKLIDEIEKGHVKEAIALTNNATETRWFAHISTGLSAVCFPDTRISFRDKNGEQKSSPLQGQALSYFGDDVEKFTSGFKKFGVIFYRKNRNKQ